MTHTHLAYAVRRLRAAAAPAATDRQLLDRFLSDRDQAAFAELVRRHGRAVLTACRQVLADPADVDDAFQATFLVLLRRARSVPWQASLGRWLFVVAHRVAVHARSASHKRRMREARLPMPDQAIEMPDLSWREAVGVLHEELDKLPDSYRLPLLLCGLEGLSRDEAAVQLGWSASVLRGRLERGRAKLRWRLVRRGIAPSAGLLAAVMGSSESVGGPAPALVQLTMRAVVGSSSSSVAALVRGAVPAVGRIPKAVAVVLVLAGLLGGGLGLSRSHSDNGAATLTVTTQGPAPATVAKTQPPLIDTTVAGRVVSTEGKPVAGAKVYWIAEVYPTPPPQLRATSNRDGWFSFLVRHPDHKQALWNYGYVFVTADGFGCGWGRLYKVDPAKLKLIVPPDDPPLTGQVIDLEGRPVAGIKVSVRDVAAPLDWKDLSGWLKAIRDPSPDRQVVGLNMIFDHGWLAKYGLFASAVTDRDGRYTLRGIGRDRLAVLRLEGNTVVTHEVDVINRTVERFAARGFLPGNRVRTYHGLPCRLVVGPSVTVVGVVKDKDMGRPIPGAKITVDGLTTTDGSYMSDLEFTSDKDGRYRVTGLPHRQRPFGPPWLKVAPPDGQPYLREAFIGVPDTKEATPVALDIEMKRGIFLTVKAIDKQTGKPVRARCDYYPLQGNPYVDQVPNYESPMQLGNPGTTAEMKLVALPGPGAVTAVAGEPYLLGVMPEGLRQFVNPPGQFNYARGGFVYNFVNTFAEVNIKPGASDATITIALDPGLSVPIAVLDPDGKELAGAVVLGQDRRMPFFDSSPLSSARFEVRALRPGEKRRVFVAHKKRKLAGSVVITGGQKGPVTVHLQAWGEVTGRLVDVNGQVVKDGQQMAATDAAGFSDLEQGASPLFPSRTNYPVPPDGRFRLSGLPPGLKFRFQVFTYQKGTFEKWARADREVIVKPGEVKDLGDVRLVPPKPPGKRP